MSLPIEKDKRYRVTKKLVADMQKARQDGKSYGWIANHFGVSHFVSYYWCNDKYREHKRQQNIDNDSYPRHNESYRIKQRVKQRRENRKEPDVRMRMRLAAAKNEYRSKRHTIDGMSIEDFEKKYQKYKKGGRKID